jgi:hypothetical protein
MSAGIPASPFRRLLHAERLLLETLDHITDKPWDDPTMLHKRICEFLGKPVPYADHIKKVEEGQYDDN